MKYLKKFENSREEFVSPQEFANKYDSEYKFIVYINGKATSGWEYLSDAIKDGIADEQLDLMSDEMMDFEDEMDMALGEYSIDIEDEMEDIDEDDLNNALEDLCGKYDFEGSVQIRFVNGDDDNEYPQDYDLERANNPDGEYHGTDPKFHDHGDEDDLTRINREMNETKIVKFDKFVNEELDKQTYLDAADKLTKIEHGKRAKRMRKHAHTFSDDQPYFTLGDPYSWIDHVARLTEEMRFIECHSSTSWLSKSVVVTFLFERDNKEKRYLVLQKNKKDDSNFVLSKRGTFERLENKGAQFIDRPEAIKFIDFINQNDECINELGELIDFVKVNSIYLPKKG